MPNKRRPEPQEPAKCGVAFLGKLDYPLSKYIPDYAERVAFIRSLETDIIWADWIEFQNGITFEKTFVPQR